MKRLDARSDIFSLGALLRFLLTKDSDSAANAAERQHLDKALEAICSKAAAPVPEGRYPNVSELAQDVSRYLDGLAVAAHRESVFEKVARFYRKYRFFILLIAAYLVMRVLILFFMHR